MDINNKTLAILLVAAIVISFAGTIISLNNLNKISDYRSTTGYATSSSGIAKVNITSTEQITFTTATIDFGEGSVNASYSNCTMYANATNVTGPWKSAGCLNFTTDMPSPFILENTGNKNVSVKLNTSTNASGFIGGGAGAVPDPEFQYAVYENEAGSCTGGVTPGIWTDVNATAIGTLICPNFLQDSLTDSLNISVRILIPMDASSGSKQATFNALGES